MSIRLFIVLSAVIGILTGFFTIHSPLAHSWMSVFLWIVVGVIVVYFSSSRKTALYAGVVFGFCTIAAWLITGFQGTTHQLLGFLLLTLGFSILGALCGWLGAYIFSKVFKKNRN